VVNTQRDRIYAERRRGVLTKDLSPFMIEYAEKTADDIVEVRWLAERCLLGRLFDLCV
jgi:preprotein translocase subunit SecA